MQNNNKIFVGYDLGDGETMISILHSVSQKPESLRMPTKSKNDEPIVTAFAYNGIDRQIILGDEILGEFNIEKYEFFANFKKKPSLLIEQLPEKWKKKFLKAKGHRELAELYEQCEAEYNENSTFIMPWCVREYTNAVFNDKNIKFALSAYADKCDEVTVFVGHPSKWDDFDIHLYQGMLERSILGNNSIKLGDKEVPLTFGLERESRAAFLFGRQEYGETKGWEVGRYALTIDVGSSTTDCTAINGLEVDSVNDGGDAILGARLIDELIYGYYRECLKKFGMLNLLDEEIQINPTSEKLCILACRQTKEQYFSGNGKTVLRILAPGTFSNNIGIDSVRLPEEEMKKLLESKIPILDNETWKDRFNSIIANEKLKIEESGHNIDKIVLTGGAARMHFVSDSCSEMFSDVNVICDHSPGRTISHGLALVGRSNERSLQFQKRAEQVLSTELEETISDRISILSEIISPIIADIVLEDIAYSELQRWRNGYLNTLNDAINGIKRKCSEKEMEKKLKSNSRYKNALKKWVEKDVMIAIGTKIRKLCDEFGLSDLTPEFLDFSNIPVNADQQVSKISGEGIIKDALHPGDVVAGLVGIVSGIVTFFITPTIIAGVLSVLIPALAGISTTIAGFVVAALGAIPVWGWGLLATIAGVAVFTIIMDGWEGMKDDLSKKMMSYNLPGKARKLVSEDKLKSTLKQSRGEVVNGIEKELTANKTKKKISNEIARVFKPQVEKKLREIKYIIESR